MKENQNNYEQLIRQKDCLINIYLAEISELRKILKEKDDYLTSILHSRSYRYSQKIVKLVKKCKKN